MTEKAANIIACEIENKNVGNVRALLIGYTSIFSNSELFSPNTNYNT